MRIEDKTLDFKFINIVLYFAFAAGIFFFLERLGVMDNIIKAILSLTPVLLGIILCWISIPLAGKFRKVGLNKSMSAIFSLVLIIGIVILVFSMVVPVFITEFSAFIKEFPNIYNSLADKINPFLANNFSIQNALKPFNEIMSMEIFKNDIVQNNLDKILTYSISTVQSVISMLITIVTTIIVAFFMVKNMDSFKGGIFMLLSRNSKNSKRHDMLIDMENAVMSYVKGSILDSIIVGVLTTIACMILGIDYAIVFGCLITVLNLIPYIGAIISEVIVALYALSVGGPIFAIITFISLVFVQLIDANILQPNIIGKSVNLHPVVVLAGLIVFNLLFGIVGMIIAMPILAIIKIFLEYKFSLSFDEIFLDENNNTKKRKKIKVKKSTENSLNKNEK